MKGIIITKENAKEFMPYFSDFVWKMLQADKKVNLKYGEFKQNRSNAQNRLMWKWHGELKFHIADSIGEVYDNDTIHEYIVSKIGNNEIKEITIKADSGNMIKDSIVIRESTSKMTVKRFTEFLTHYEHYVRNKYGLQFSHPEDLYYMAMGN